MKLVTWNVNSLKARLPRVLEFLGEHAPDVVCMQETKTEDAAFPTAELAAAGYHAVHHSTFEEKLAFLDAAAARIAALRAQGAPLIVAGDFNVAPTDLDVYDPAAFVGSTHVTPAERGRVEALLGAGELVDAYRALHPDEVQYTWWDYRQGHFHRGLGLRIDLVLLSAALAAGLEHVGIERTYRKGSPKPSDHAPLVATVAAP